MRTLLYLACAAMTIGLVVLGAHWTDPFHYVTGLATLLILSIAVGSVVWLRSRSQPKLQPAKGLVRPVQDNPARSVFLGTLTGLLIALCLWGSFGILKGWPAYAGRFYDADRETFTQLLRAHEIGGHHDQAVTLLRERLQHKMTQPWRRTLTASLYSNLVAAGQHADSPTQKVQLLTEARDLARSADLDGALALALLQPASREIEFAAQIETLRAAKEWQRILDALRGPLRERGASPQTRILAQCYYEALFHLAETTVDFQMKRKLLDEAVAVARTHELDASEAAVQLQQEQTVAAKQTELSGKIDRLKSERAWSELTSLLKLTMADTPKVRWPRPWDKELFDTLCSWAGDSIDTQVKLAKLREAFSFAATNKLDATSASHQIKTIEAETEARANFARRVVEFRAHSMWADLIAFLRVGMNRPRSEWPQPLDELLYDTQLSSADATTDTMEKRRLLHQALETAKSFNLNAQLAESRLKMLDAKLAEMRQLEEEQKRLAEEQRRLTELLNRPADLPQDTRVGMASVSEEFLPPSFDIEVFVEDARGRPIRNLGKKDFAFTCFGRSPRNVELAAIQREMPPLHLVVALDVSGSVDASAMAAAIKAVRDLLMSFVADDTVWVKVITFGSNVRTVCDWTKDKYAAAATVLDARAGGETALFQAIAQAEQDLCTRLGERRLFLFTDGKNTVRGKRDLGLLTADLRKASIKVLAIGLRTHDLDRSTLTQLAKATAGTFLEADGSAQIASTFQTAQQRLRRAVYRFSVTPEVPSNATELPVEIKVGGANAVVVRHALPMSQVTTAAK